jgi:thiol-disulfide isomerase/thioredoxin
MKKYLMFVVAATMLVGIHAQRAKKVTVLKNAGYTIIGTVEGRVDKDTVYLGRSRGLFFVPEDTAIIKNGEFHFKEKPAIARLLYIFAPKKGDEKAITFDFIFSNDNLNIKVMKDKKMSKVIDNHNNDLWLEYHKRLTEIDDSISPYWKAAKDNATKKDVINRYSNVCSAYAINFLINHLPSGASDVLLEITKNKIDKSTMQTILDKMKRVCPEDPLYVSLVKQIKIESKTIVGSDYTDIELNDPKGNPMKLSSFVSKNKVTMIDFWASWCGPCRAEMPNVVNTYKQYKDKGFAIVGVSLDNNLEAWKGAIEKLGITWPQMSDLKGWGSKGAAAYNVKAIPATVLIDSKGKIIAKNLRGAELDAKLKDILQ